jgi:hypothetical protein
VVGIPPELHSMIFTTTGTSLTLGSTFPSRITLPSVQFMATQVEVLLLKLMRSWKKMRKIMIQKKITMKILSMMRLAANAAS